MFVVVLSFFRSPRGLVDVLVHGAALQPHRDAMLWVGRPIIQGEGLEPRQQWAMVSHGITWFWIDALIG